MSGYPILGVAVSETPADSNTTFEVGGHKVGVRHQDHRGYVYQYVHANGAIDQYDYVLIDEAGECFQGTKALAEDHATVAVAPVAFADNDYGWVMLKGVTEVHGLTSCAADTQLYTSGTAGHLDDADASQYAVTGIRLTTAVGGGGADDVACVLDFPRVVMPFDGA